MLFLLITGRLVESLSSPPLLVAGSSSFAIESGWGILTEAVVELDDDDIGSVMVGSALCSNSQLTIFSCPLAVA